MKNQWMNETRLVFALRLLVCCTFLGRAYQHIRWEAPYRALLWSQHKMEPLITGVFGVEWRDWVNNTAVDMGIQNAINITGWFYLLCAVLALTVSGKTKFQQFVLAFGGAMLFFLAYLYFLDKGSRIGQWIEYSLQFGGPIFLIAAVRGHICHPKLVFSFKVAIALTFIGHGLYAAGIYPQPGNFVTMLMNGVGLSEDMSRQLLVAAGYLDFIAAALIFFPAVNRPALAYMAFWGFATALARMVSYYDPIHIGGWLDAWAFQTIYRMIHGGAPLLLMFIPVIKSEQPAKLNVLPLPA